MKEFCVVLSMVATVVVADQLPYQPAPYHAPAPAPYHAPAPAPYHAPEPAYAPAPAPYHAPAPAPYHAPAPHPVPVHHVPKPAPYHAPHPAPYHAPHHEEPYHAPKPYVFGYDINDYDPYGNPDVHSRHEESDGKVVKGQYKVVQDDCRTRIVDYFVDEYKKFHADVKYEGKICYPEKKPHHGPAPYHAPKPAPYHAPKPHPAPAPYHAPAPAPYHAPAPAPYHAPAP